MPAGKFNLVQHLYRGVGDRGWVWGWDGECGRGRGRIARKKVVGVLVRILNVILDSMRNYGD